MDLSIILSALVVQYPILASVLAVLGSLVVVGTVYVKITPSKTDDAWFDKLEAIPLVGTVLKLLVSFSPIERKDPSVIGK